MLCPSNLTENCIFFYPTYFYFCFFYFCIFLLFYNIIFHSIVKLSGGRFSRSVCFFPIYTCTVCVVFTHVISPVTVQSLVHSTCPSRLCTPLAAQPSRGFSTAIMRTQCCYHATYVINVTTNWLPLHQLSAGIKTTQRSPAWVIQEKFGVVPACPLLSPRYFHAD